KKSAAAVMTDIESSTAKISHLVSYRSTVTFEGKSRTYRAVFLWTVDHRVVAWDEIVQGLQDAMNETAPVPRAPIGSTSRGIDEEWLNGLFVEVCGGGGGGGSGGTGGGPAGPCLENYSPRWRPAQDFGFNDHPGPIPFLEVPTDNAHVLAATLNVDC